MKWKKSKGNKKTSKLKSTMKMPHNSYQASVSDKKKMQTADIKNFIKTIDDNKKQQINVDSSHDIKCKWFVWWQFLFFNKRMTEST